MNGRTAGYSARLLFLGVLAAGLVPWVVVIYADGGYALFALGWIDFGTWHVVSMPTYYARLAGGPMPRQFLTWFVATVLWIAALGSVAWRDRRLTAGLLGLAGLDVFWYALALSGQRGILAVPLGTVALLAGAAGVLWLATVRE